MKDVIVIGGGIIGRTAAKALADQGRDVLLLDDARPLSGTKPSGGHMKPSWFGKMPKEEYTPAIELLEQTWGVEKIEFCTYPSERYNTVYRVDTDVVMKYPAVNEQAHTLYKLDNYPEVVYGTPPQSERCRLLVVATGAWVPELLSHIEVKGKMGVSFRVNAKIDEPFIKPWAPYKQVVAHIQKPGEVWIGDGSAILAKNWTDQTTVKCRDRCLAAMKAKPGTRYSVLKGIRPYAQPVEDWHPCLFQQLGPRAWVATGAGKCGTISAGWVTRRLLNEGK